MKRLRLLDLYSCAGGAAMGYHRAGFEVVGVDIDPQPRYPFEHVVGDALEVLDAIGQEFDAIHASPPCQAFSRTKTLHTNQHPDLISATRAALEASGRPYIIENVPGAPLVNPLQLCGTEFDMRARDVDGVELKLVRHRLFESNVPLLGAGGCRHDSSIITASVYGAGGGWTPAHRDSPARRRLQVVPRRLAVPRGRPRRGARTRHSRPLRNARRPRSRSARRTHRRAGRYCPPPRSGGRTVTASTTRARSPPPATTSPIRALVVAALPPPMPGLDKPADGLAPRSRHPLEGYLSPIPTQHE